MTIGIDAPDGTPSEPSIEDRLGILEAEARAQADEKLVKNMVEITSKTFDRATAYANVVLVAGYAGGFTIWSFTRAQIPLKANLVIGLALLISVATFVAFEVVKTTVTSALVYRQAGLLQSVRSNADKIVAMGAISSAHSVTMERFLVFWIVSWVVSVFGALLALSLLAWNFLAGLTGLPQWPS